MAATDVGREFIEPNLLARIEAQENKDGIDLRELPVGAKVTVETQNSTYSLEKLPDNLYSLQGGKRWQTPTRVFISGSTYGGSLLKIGWLGDGMNMEIHQESDRKCVVTSAITNLWIENAN